MMAVGLSRLMATVFVADERVVVRFSVIGYLLYLYLLCVTQLRLIRPDRFS
jgi:hypothetical protein